MVRFGISNFETEIAGALTAYFPLIHENKIVIQVTIVTFFWSILNTLFNNEGVEMMLEDHDMKDRQVHAHLQPVVLGILVFYVAIMAVGYWAGSLV